MVPVLRSPRERRCESKTMGRDLREDSLHPGRYAAIDVGTNSVLLLVADISPAGELVSVHERS
jgi:hypothetical protein